MKPAFIRFALGAFLSASIGTLAVPTSAQAQAVFVEPPPVVVVRPRPVIVEPAYVAPPGVVYVRPTYVMPGRGYLWRYHARYGWGWYHPAYGWHRGWHQ